MILFDITILCAERTEENLELEIVKLQNDHCFESY